MSFKIITDSSANLTNELIEKFSLDIISLKYYINGEEFESYIPGKETDLKAFYKRIADKEKATTSLVGVDTFKKVFTEKLSEGGDVMYIGFSSGLSGTLQSAKIAAEDVLKSFPQQKLVVIDSLCAALGQGLFVYYICKLREQGKSIEECAKWAEENRLHICHWFTVDDLMYLKRGGRLSATSAILGTILGIKPVLHMDDDGKLAVVSKARGRKAALDALIKHMDDTAINLKDQYVFISHGDCIEDAQYVADKIKGKVSNVLINTLEPVIGCHSGPGTLALFFLGTKR